MNPKLIELKIYRIVAYVVVILAVLNWLTGEISTPVFLLIFLIELSILLYLNIKIIEFKREED